MNFFSRANRGVDHALSPPSPTDAWRTAATRVWSCWDAFLAAPRSMRSRTFAAYMAAIDAEEAAATRVAELYVPMAA
jgi:hypothetical protein